MRVLVTGGAGYIGSRVVEALIEGGLEVTVLDALLYGGEGLLPFLDHPRFRLVTGDLRDASRVREALVGAEAVVHLAALVGEAACQVDPYATLAINTEASEQFARLAADSGVRRFIFVSTCSNYGVSSPDALADEDTPLRPLSLYAETKIRAEHIILRTGPPRLVTCVLRFGTICGLSPRMRFNLLVNELARSSALGRPMSLYGLEAWRPFLHIRDAARVVRLCLAAPEGILRDRIFNVVSENCQKRQLAVLVRRHFPEGSIEMKDAQADLRDYRVSAGRITRELGFHPEHTVEQAFLEIATAVRAGLFHDPDRPLYDALPDKVQMHALV